MASGGQGEMKKPVQSQRGRSLGAAALLAALAFLAYANSFSAGFVLDNRALLLQDPRIREFTAENLRLIFQHTYWWPTGEVGLYRPFTTLTYLFNYAVLGNGTDPAGYHWVNFLLHLGNVFLVLALARRLLRDFWPSFFAAALWAVHPVLTESVTNMIGRADLLAAAAILGGLLMYLKAAETTGRPRLAWLAGLMVATTVGVFSKENAVTLGGVIVLYELAWWKERKPGRIFALGWAATLLPILVMLALRFHALRASKPPEFPFVDNPIIDAGFWTGRLMALRVMGRYLWITFWPANLSADYSYAQITLINGAVAKGLVGIAAVAAILLVAALYRWNRAAFFYLAFAAITFVPTSNLLFPIGTIMAERLLYLPAIGLMACLVMAVYAAGERIPITRFAPVLLALILAAFTVRTWVRNGDWQDDRSLAEANVRTSPNSFKGHVELANVLYAGGGAGSDIDGAIIEAERAVEILNPLPDARKARDPFRLAGGLHLIKGDAVKGQDASQSLREYQRALALLQRAVAIDRALAEDFNRKGGAEWARRHSSQATGYKSDSEARWLLAAAWVRLGNTAEASAAASEALALHPSTPGAYRLIASIFAAQQRIDDAATALIEGILMTSDPNLKSDLLNLYRSALSNTCVMTTGSSGPDWNVNCDLFRKHFCAAAVESLKSAVEAERFDVAREQKQDFEKNYGCPAGPLDQVAPN